MMEFTLSRTVMMVCGMIVLASVVIPISDIYSAKEGEDIQTLAEKDATFLDRFWSSGLDELYVDGSALLPSGDYVIEIEGLLLSIKDTDGKAYNAGLSHEMDLMVIEYGGSYTLCRLP